MTVKEFIELLEDYEQNSELTIGIHNGDDVVLLNPNDAIIAGGEEKTHIAFVV